MPVPVRHRQTALKFAAVGKHHQLRHNALDDADLRASRETMDESVTLTIFEERLNYDSIEKWFLMSMQSQIPLECGVILYERKAQLPSADLP